MFRFEIETDADDATHAETLASTSTDDIMETVTSELATSQPDLEITEMSEPEQLVVEVTTTSSPTSSPTNSPTDAGESVIGDAGSSSSSDNSMLIMILGGVFGVFAIAVFVLWCRCRRGKNLYPQKGDTLEDDLELAAISHAKVRTSKITTLLV